MSHSSQISPLVDWKIKACEDQTQWGRLYCIWKSFQKSQQEYTKSYIGLSFFGIKEGYEATHLEDYYLCYDPAQRKIIDNIYNQLEFDGNRVILAHTYLYLSLDDIVVCVFRQIKPNDKITFIDHIGRVYTSWDHFIGTNDLPSCCFIAPDNGVYAVNGKLNLYKSPAKLPKAVLASAGDAVASVLMIGSVGLGALAMAPVTAIALGVTGATYAVGRSIGTLVDRSDHGQSIAPDNLESAVSWLNIGTSAFTGISAVGLPRIVAMSGKYSSVAITTLKGLNYVTLAGTVFNFGAYLIHFEERLRNDELSTKDLLELSANVFLMYGAVSNVRQMHNYLKNFNQVEVSAPSKSLSRTMKRKLCRMRAKLRLNGGTATTTITATPNPEVMDVGKFDSNLTQWGTALVSVGCHMMFQRCPSAHRIYCKCMDIINTVNEFRSQRLPIKTFISNMINHAYNLYIILTENMEELKDTVLQFLRPYFGANAPPQLTHDVAGILDNSVMALNNVDEELPEPDDNDESNTPEDDRAKYEIILDLVQRRVDFIEKNSSVLLIKTFLNELSQVTRQITSQVQEKYDEIISFNVSAVGEEKAKHMLSKIGINSKTDFAETVFGKIVEDMKFDSCPFTQRSAVLNKLITEIRKIFISVSGVNDVKKMSVQETCEILEKLISTFMEPFTETYSFASDFYAKNSSVFGKKFGRVMLLEALDIEDDRDIGPALNQDTIFDVALKKTNLCEVIRKLSPSTCTTTSVVTKDETFSDDFKIKNLFSLCSSIYQKINPMLDHSLRAKNLKRVFYFVTHEFTVRFQNVEKRRTDMKNISQKLKLNESHLGKQNFSHMCRILIGVNKREIFDQVMNEFQREDTISNLIDEYIQQMSSDDVNVEVCKNIVADDGMKIYTIEMERHVGWNEYKATAAHLFDLRECTIRPISNTGDLVILKSDDKYVMFHFIEKENMALIMQVDSLASGINE